MKRVKRILVVVKSDEISKENPVVVRGLELASSNNAAITLMGVVSIPGRALTQYKGIFKAGELSSMLVNDFEQALNNLVDELGSELDIRVRVETGRDFIEIIRQAVYHKHDLIIKTANEQAKSFDSSDFHLMRKSPVPVWLYKNGPHADQRKVLAAVDLDLEADEEGRSLNGIIMDFASSLAQWQKAELHVLSCWALYGEAALRDSAFMRVSEREIGHLLEQEEREYQEKQSALLARYEEFDVVGHLSKGQPTDLIPEFVTEHQINTIVMGTVARSGIPGLLIGNTAETILSKINASVITIKPPGFESIVK